MRASILKSILREHTPALIVGNGINLYGNSGNGNSWEALLQQLASNHQAPQTRVPKGISLTEFYDVLDIANGNPGSTSSKSAPSLQKEFCDLMQSWSAESHHKLVAQWAKDNNKPILTTNFEDTLGSGIRCTLNHTTTKGFTDYYPWASYYGHSHINGPSHEFGIWHINGMQHYSRSIRLGLSHYMGSVERARRWLHKGKEDRLFSGKNHVHWSPAPTALMRTGFAYRWSNA